MRRCLVRAMYLRASDAACLMFILFYLFYHGTAVRCSMQRNTHHLFLILEPLEFGSHGLCRSLVGWPQRIETRADLIQNRDPPINLVTPNPQVCQTTPFITIRPHSSAHPVFFSYCGLCWTKKNKKQYDLVTGYSRNGKGISNEEEFCYSAK